MHIPPRITMTSDKAIPMPEGLALGSMFAPDTDLYASCIATTTKASYITFNPLPINITGNRSVFSV